ncbi:hypothetical protein V7O66_13715 [Methanolobus sp. ZRKC3]|uniref:hypothetical protein n=1 Tax=Methanolobus sp. ZRKC3 TaxID=3125786 RepID=UPI003243C224
MGFRSYQKLYAQNMPDSKFTWGGITYGKMLHLSGEAVPDSVSVSTYTQIYGMGSSSSHVVCIDQDYILPYPFDIVSALDGTISGTFKVSIYGYGDVEVSKAELSSIDIQMFAIDSDGNSRELCDQQTVWSGDETANGGETITIAAMYWFSIQEELYTGERLMFNIQLTGYSGGYTGNILAWMRLYHSKNTDELSVTLPLVV